MLLSIMLSSHFDIAEKAVKELSGIQLSERELNEIFSDLENRGKKRVLFDLILQEDDDEFKERVRSLLKVPETASARIKTLSKSLDDFTYKIHTYYSFANESLQLEVLLKSQSLKDSVLEIIREYEDVIKDVKFIVPSLEGYIEDFDYENYQALLEESIEDSITYILENEPEAIYFFSICLSQDHSILNIDWATQKEYKKIQERYAESSESELLRLKYSPAEFQKDIVFVEEEVICGNLRDYNESLETIIEKFGYDAYWEILNPYRAELLEFTIRALKVSSEKFTKLKSTSDFVYFVYPYDYDQETRTSAFRQTVNDEMFQYIYPDCT